MSARRITEAVAGLLAFWLMFSGQLRSQPAGVFPAGSSPTNLVGNTSPRPPSTDAAGSIELAWRFVDLGNRIGENNIIVSNGLIIAGPSYNKNYWYALSYDPATSDYRQVYVSKNYSKPIKRIVMADVVGDAGKEIIIALDDGRVFYYDGDDRAEVGSIQTSCTLLTGLAVADWDQDSVNELLMLKRGAFYVYSPDGQLEWYLSNADGFDLVAGQMDGDPSLEIALGNGTIIDAAARSFQWQISSLFAVDMELLDVDNDGMEELVAGSNSKVEAFDVDTRQLKWTMPYFDISSITIADVDGDTAAELLVGESQGGEVVAFDLTTRTQLWNIYSPEWRVKGLTVGDVDQDGINEVVWGADSGSSGGSLHVGDWSSGTVEWRSIDLSGPFIGPLKGDVDGDGVDEFVVACQSTNSGYQNGRILVFGGRDLRLRGVSPMVPGSYSFTSPNDICLRDVDGDGAQDILTATDDAYSGVITIYGFDASNQFSVKWTNSSRPSQSPFMSVEAMDIDNDGQIEIVGGVRRANAAAPGVFVYVYDYATGNEEWHSPQLGYQWDEITRISLADLDQDGRIEIAAMIHIGDVYVFDGVTKNLDGILFGPFLSMRTHEFNHTICIVCSDSSSRIIGYAWNGSTYAFVGLIHFGIGAIPGFTIGPLNSVWVSSGRMLSVFVPWSSSVLWQSDSVPAQYGRQTVFAAFGNIIGFLTAGSFGVDFYRAD